MALNEDERRRACKALWGWSLLDQPAFAEAAGITHSRLRTMLDEGKKSPPTTDELFELARAAGVPESFAIDGVGDASLRGRVAELDTANARLGDAVRQTSAEVLRLRREFEALRDSGQSAGRAGGNDR